MLISGFTFARNAVKLGYPVVESIRSILPICDEFIIALGRGDKDDETKNRIEALKEPKIRIIETDWTELGTLCNWIYSQQTNIALNECRGVWSFYLQSDEVVHESYLNSIKAACNHFAGNDKVDGFLFRYKHFWGDYEHYIVSHKWYSREIRIIRNKRGIISVGDAQSFRYSNGKKVRVVELDAEIFHYGHVRDPRFMKVMKKVATGIYRGEEIDISSNSNQPGEIFDYGSLECLPVYRGPQPAVMKQRIAEMNWKHLLQYSGPSKTKHRHDSLWYRFLTFIEQKILRGSGREFWGYKPYHILRKLSKQYSKSCRKTVIL